MFQVSSFKCSTLQPQQNSQCPNPNLELSGGKVGMSSITLHHYIESRDNWPTMLRIRNNDNPWPQLDLDRRTYPLEQTGDSEL